MFRLSNPRVRRRLFEPDDLADQAKIDNFANILQESIKQDIVEKSEKWNFDFVKELPLEGTYKWYPGNGDTADWIGVKEVDKEKDINMKSENESTPKTKGDAVPIVRKRRRNTDRVPDKAVRRRISF